MLNLTPHAISLCLSNGQFKTFPPSGQIARVTTTEKVVGEVEGVPLVEREMGEAEGLPSEGVPCIVSAMVAAACKGRKGVYAPDSGPTAKRDARGQITAVTRLIAA